MDGLYFMSKFIQGDTIPVAWRFLYSLWSWNLCVMVSVLQAYTWLAVVAVTPLKLGMELIAKSVELKVTV